MFRQSALWFLSAWVLVFASALGACTSEEGVTIEVRVVSDLVPEREVATVTAALFRGIANESPTSLGATERDLAFGEPLARGLWVTTFENVPPGVYTIWVTLLRQNGEILGRRPLTATVAADASYTVTLTADCARVECPNAGGNASFLACIAGQCVDPSCTPETPENCPPGLDLFCDAKDECTPLTTCNDVACVERVCVNEVMVGECGSDEFCSSLSGCTVEVPPLGAPDDVPGICGDACALSDAPCGYSYYVCDVAGDPVCTVVASRPAGYPCANGGTCDLEGVCVPGRVDGGVSGDAGTELDASVDGDVASDAGAPDAYVAPDAFVQPDLGGPCESGYAGSIETGCFDIDECMYNVCDRRTTCTNTEGGFSCSSCPSGYVGTGETGCVLENACDEDPCDALTVCNPTGVGTYECSACPSGYAGTGAAGCADLNECGYAGACDPSVTCTNTPGSYTCGACPRGYEGDGRSGCVDTNECLLRTHDCDSYCVNEPGTFRCVDRFGVFVGGEGQTCAIRPDDGELACWGVNYAGQLGNGSFRDVMEPPVAPVNLGAGRYAVDVAMAYEYTCALLDNGSVKCWGYNYDGQLGLGTFGPGNDRIATPTDAVDFGGRGVRAISVGSGHSCALVDDGTVECWGGNWEGQLGVGTSGELNRRSSVPAGPIALGRDAVAIACGGSHSCALLDDGNVRCWGYNGSGQLGIGSTTPLRLSAPGPAVALGAGRRATAISLGESHSCALLDDDSVKCWGYNGEGALGVGDNDDRSAPEDESVRVPGTPVQLLALGYTTCVLLEDGGLSCWGGNWAGQLGYGDTDGSNAPREEAARIAGDVRALSLSRGFVYSHLCATFEDTTARCWGYNGSGQLGFETPSLSAPSRVWTPDAPIDFGGASPSAMLAKADSTCARLSDGTYTCWGSNGNGQFGYGDTNERSRPGDTLDLAGGRLVLGNAHSCAIATDGSVRCWGQNGNGQLGYGDTTQRSAIPATTVDLGEGRAAVDVVVGNNHTCALLDDGSVSCWGYNEFGSGLLGTNETIQYRATPARVLLDDVATAIVAGDNFTCVLLEGGAVKCWGANQYGQLGYGDRLPRRKPASTSLSLARPAVALAAGSQHACARLNDGSVSCWGYNNDGQVGDGTRNPRLSPASPISFGAGRRAVSLVTGAIHTCALLDDNSARCWGYNGEGGLGYGRSYIRATSPPEVAIRFEGDRTPVSMTAGNYHTCATFDDGTATCWGANWGGQLGIGRSEGRSDYVLAPDSRVLGIGGGAL
jgi:alpha-tubulin suppressor-like RCC1 family protein